MIFEKLRNAVNSLCCITTLPVFCLTKVEKKKRNVSFCYFLEYFQMGKMHKEIAKFLIQSSEDENMADEDIIKVFAVSCVWVESIKFLVLLFCISLFVCVTKLIIISSKYFLNLSQVSQIELFSVLNQPNKIRAKNKS